MGEFIHGIVPIVAIFVIIFCADKSGKSIKDFIEYSDKLNSAKSIEADDDEETISLKKEFIETCKNIKANAASISVESILYTLFAITMFAVSYPN